MATDNGPDLTGAKAAVEALMDDTCTAARNPDADDELGVDLRYDRGDDVQLYDGPCSITTEGDSGQAEQIGRVTKQVKSYRLSTPLPGPDLRTGDRVTCTSSRRDPRMPGKTFIVQSPVFKTFAISRKFTMTLESETPAEEVA